MFRKRAMTETTSPPILPKSGKSCLLKGLIVLVILALVLGGLWWWLNRPIQPVVLSVAEKAEVEVKVEALQKPAEPQYEKGAKEIVLTERELNGLLNERTTLGKTLHFELGSNVVLASVETDLAKDLPVLGGKRLKARARFVVGGTPGHPSFVIDDLTVWGISLPNDWLAGLKGRDLLGEMLGGQNGKIVGVEEFKVEPGKLVIRLAE